MAGTNQKTPRRLLGKKALIPVITTLMFSMMAAAQTQQSNAQEGKVAGNYVVEQSVELGYRVTGINGNESVYGTFVNLQDGPRLLDYTVNMRSITRTGSLFDSFYLNNAGYGGDPNNYSRLRVSKNGGMTSAEASGGT